jgi:hypothetical protein
MCRARPLWQAHDNSVVFRVAEPLQPRMRPDPVLARLWPMPLPFSKTVRRLPQPEQIPAGDSYLTDGQRLFRVVTQLPPRHGSPFALIEDCHTLEVRAFSPDELYEMGLRPVRAGAAKP